MMYRISWICLKALGAVTDRDSQEKPPSRHIMYNVCPYMPLRIMSFFRAPITAFCVPTKGINTPFPLSKVFALAALAIGIAHLLRQAKRLDNRICQTNCIRAARASILVLHEQNPCNPCLYFLSAPSIYRQEGTWMDLDAGSDRFHNEHAVPARCSG